MTPFALLARNNAWANARLLDACDGLAPGEWEAPRTGFFPSLRATMEHIHAVDRYYIDAATGVGLGPSAFRETPHFSSAAAMRPMQEALDRRLIAFCDGLEGMDTGCEVVTDRGERGRHQERLDRLLLHLFQHQIYHLGQAHAMLSGTSVAPPQLDEFFLDYDRHPGAEAFP